MTSFRSRSDGSHYPVRGRSLFNSPPAHPQLAKEISISSPSEARESVSHLNAQWETAGHQKRVLLIRAANQAANRAKVGSQNPNFSSSEREQMAEVSRIYRSWVDSHKFGK